MLESVCAGKLTIQRVKAPVFLINHNYVLQPVDSVLAFFALVVWWICKRDTGRSYQHRRSRCHSGNAFHKINALIVGGFIIFVWRFILLDW